MLTVRGIGAAIRGTRNESNGPQSSHMSDISDLSAQFLDIERAAQLVA